MRASGSPVNRMRQGPAAMSRGAAAVRNSGPSGHTRCNSLHERLVLENFTAFGHADIAFVPGINVLVGGNATGKTHLMKLLYALQKHQHEVSKTPAEVSFSNSLQTTFNVERIGRLVRRGVGVQSARVVARWQGRNREFSLDTRSHVLNVSGPWGEPSRPVFIPVKDMLAHTKGFGPLFREHQLDFEQVYSDIVDLAMIPPLRGAMTPDRKVLLGPLQKSMRGTVTQKLDRFYLRIREGGHTASLEMPLVAEGWRKLALLWLLIQNGSLRAPGVLFWDEPETNLNPSMYAIVSEVLSSLALSGVQVFVATHDYVMLQNLNLNTDEQDGSAALELRFIALARNGDGEVTAETVDDYLSIAPNLIEEAYSRVYDRKLARQLGGNRRNGNER